MKIKLATLIEEGLATRGTMVRFGLSIYLLSMDLTSENYEDSFGHRLYPWKNVDYSMDNNNLYFLPTYGMVELI